MRITKRDTPALDNFADLNLGVTFEYAGEYYLKTVNGDCYTDEVGNSANAIRLNDGRVFSFRFYDRVEIKEIELVVY